MYRRQTKTIILKIFYLASENLDLILVKIKNEKLFEKYTKNIGNWLLRHRHKIGILEFGLENGKQMN